MPSEALYDLIHLPLFKPVLCWLLHIHLVVAYRMPKQQQQQQSPTKCAPPKSNKCFHSSIPHKITKEKLPSVKQNTAIILLRQQEKPNFSCWFTFQITFRFKLAMAVEKIHLFRDLWNHELHFYPVVGRCLSKVFMYSYGTQCAPRNCLEVYVTKNLLFSAPTTFYEG